MISVDNNKKKSLIRAPSLRAHQLDVPFARWITARSVHARLAVLQTHRTDVQIETAVAQRCASLIASEHGRACRIAVRNQQKERENNDD